MADVVIRGMEMPRCCALCDLEHWDEDSYGDEINHRCCLYRKGYTAKVRETGRLPDCPLVPLPAGHGRLGDLTEIEKKLQNTLDGMGDRWLSSPTLMAQRAAIVSDLKKVKEASTIIPPEGTESK